MYDHVIIPFDGSEMAREAVMFGAGLTKVFDSRAVVVTTSVMDDPDVVAQFKARAVAMSDETVDIWFESSTGTSAGIATTVDYRPDSIVCLSTHARSGLARLLKGSVAEKVLGRIDCPIVLLGPNHMGGDPIDARRLIVCIDGSDTADSVVPLAAAWARELGLACTLLHVTDGNPPPDLDVYAELLESVSPDVEKLIIAGPSVVEGILEVVRGSAQAFVVMGAHGRSGLDRLRSGSRIIDVVRESPMPVLVQRAAGYAPTVDPDARERLMDRPSAEPVTESFPSFGPESGAATPTDAIRLPDPTLDGWEVPATNRLGLVAR